jgi:hypothetical protein
VYPKEARRRTFVLAESNRASPASYAHASATGSESRNKALLLEAFGARAVAPERGDSDRVAAESNSRTNDRAAGLCADCAHARRIASERGSSFYLCRLSVTDPAFPKYPRLPVLQCAGYVREDTNAGEKDPGE